MPLIKDKIGKECLGEKKANCIEEKTIFGLGVDIKMANIL